MKLHNKKRMIFFGCSFTAGHELIDHELLHVTFEECNLMKAAHLRKKRPQSEFENFLMKRAEISDCQYIELSSKRSYAAKLAKKLGLEHVNYAEPGNAIEHSVLKLFNAFYSGELNPETDLIFLGLTTPHRYLYFTERGIAISKVMGHLNYSPEDLHYNDYKIMQSYYLAMENFKNFCKVNSFDVILQPVLNKDFLLTGVVQPEYELFSDIDENWEYIPIFKNILIDVLKYSIDEDETLVSKYNPEKHGVCGFKHPTEIAHKFFSEALYDKITKSKN
jgi:hypothetical protein